MNILARLKKIFLSEKYCYNLTFYENLLEDKNREASYGWIQQEFGMKVTNIPSNPKAIVVVATEVVSKVLSKNEVKQSN